MKTASKVILMALITAWCGALQAQVLSLDFNERGNDPATNTYAGFTSFLINSNVSATAKQTNAAVRTFGGITVTLTGAGTDPSVDDRQRAQPTNGPAFTQSLLLRDFVFSPDGTTAGGLNVQIDGLTAYQPYQVTLWSYDNGSPGARVSDWFAQGVKVVTNYTSDGSVLPTSNTQYQMVFKASADATGRLLITGRRVSGTLSVFLNALQLDLTSGEPPSVTAQPVPVTVYAGDNAIFRATVAGSPPFQYQWCRNGQPMTEATNAALVITNAQADNAADYTLVATSPMGFGSVTSAPAALTVLGVTDIRSGRVAWWPLDEITDGATPDAAPGQYSLYATNLTAGEVVPGWRDGALRLYGTNSYVTRQEPGGGLMVENQPAYTVTLWVKGQGTNQGDRRVFSASSGTNNNPLVTLGTANTGNTNTLDIYIRNNDGSNPINHLKSSLAVFDDTWHHVAWVDNNGTGRVYVDGVLDTNVFNYTRGNLTPTITSLGTVYRTNAQALFNGAIDEVALWRRALTAAEISFVMTNGPEVLPRIRVQTPSQVVQQTSNLTLTAGIQSPTAYGCQWYRSGTNLMAEATGTTLVLTNASLADAGGYTLVVTNAAGAVTSAVVVLTINQWPLAEEVLAGAVQDSPANYPVAKLLRHAWDPDGDPVSLLAVSAASTNNGTLSLTGDTLSYTPPGGYAGYDAFTYTVSDGRGGQASGWVVVSIINSNNLMLNRVSGPTWTATNSVVVGFAGIPTLSCVLQRSTNLVNWEAILTNTIPANGILQCVDPNPLQPTSFYRITGGQ
jgi:hypothetical protein